MPFTRPALTVGPGPLAAPDARRWVAAALEEVGRTDLDETARLAISELVSNAFLHGSDPITLRLRGDVDHPRIEVRDGSPTAPRVPEPSEIGLADDLLALDGRGLALVARASTAWGVTLDDAGKVVWFEPAADLAEGDGVAADLADHRRMA